MLAFLLALPLSSPASSRWSSHSHDAITAALVGSGVARPLGPDPSQWASLQSNVLGFSQTLGPYSGLSDAVCFAGPLDGLAAFGGDVDLLSGVDGDGKGYKDQAYRSGRLRLGLARALRASEGRSGPALGAALILFDRMDQRGGESGAALDFGVRTPLPWKGFSGGLAARDLAVFGSDQDALAGEGVVGLAYGAGAAMLSLDLDLAIRGRLTARVGATYLPVPWFQFAAGYTTPEVEGQGPLLGVGGGYRRAQLEVDLSALHRGGPARTSLQASVAWHFNEAVAAAPRARRATPTPTPQTTPEPDPGTFDVQAAYHDKQLHVAWPGAPAADSYDLLMGLVPGASMKKVNEEPLHRRSWAGTPGMQGMTYYFRVRALDIEGLEIGRSRLQSVQVPEGAAP